MEAEHESALQRATLTVAMLTSFMTPFMGASVNLALPRVTAELGLDAVMLSWIATAYVVAAVVFLLPFGRLADIHGRRRIFSAGLACFLAGSLAAALARTGAMLIAARVIQGLGGGMVFVGAGLFVLGVGFGLFSSPNTNAVMGSVEPRYYGLASAMVGTMRMLGQMFSMATATLVIAVVVGRNVIGPENQAAFLGGTRGLLAGFAVLSALGIVASVARGRMHAR